MKKTLIALAVVLSSVQMFAQGTADDYRRAFSLGERFSSSKVYYSNVTPVWVDGTHSFWYLRHTPQGDEYVVVDADKKARRLLFDNRRLAQTLSEATGVDIDASELGIASLNVGRDLSSMTFVKSGHRWEYNIRKSLLKDLGPLPEREPQPHWMVVSDEKDFPPVPSPDGRYVAFIRNHNVAVREIATGNVRELSLDGALGNYYSSYIQWSPDSKYVLACKLRPAEKHYVYYVESSPKDQLQPKLHKQEYAKPGEELNFHLPCIFNVETGEYYAAPQEQLRPQYDLHSLRWNKDGRAATFEFNERGHKHYKLMELSAENGGLRTLIDESSDKFVNYSRLFRHHTSDDTEIIWSSERDNYNHLYLYDKATGQVKNQITKGEWYVRQVIGIDEDERRIYFAASGVEKDEDPYFIRYYSIGFDGSDMRDLTPSKGMHKGWLSHDNRYIVDVVSTVADAPVAVLRNADDGTPVMELEKADISEIVENGWKAPEVFVAKGRDGKTDMWGIIIRPTNFDPGRKYPILEYIYSGPGDHYVPKNFFSFNRYMSAIAELGFIVVQVDCMGTSYRSKEFEEVCYRNLKDAGIPDRKLWIKAAAEKYPYMDIDRIGIFGCSAGGQESMTAVLFHPDFYKAAYSACGCHDNRMDKIWWNEQWLGYPVGDQYKEGSNVENAHLLTRPLMLMVGEMDDNVDPASTMQVVNALIKANKDFELIVMPGVAHSMGEEFGEHKRYDFFVRNLLGVNPPAWNEL